MRFNEFEVGMRVKCPMSDHGEHTVIEVVPEPQIDYGGHVVFDDHSIITERNPAVQHFTPVAS